MKKNKEKEEIVLEEIPEGLKEIIFKGKLSIEYEETSVPYIIDESGLKINLINRIAEIDKSFNHPRVGFEYRVSNEQKTEEELIEGFLARYYGNVQSEIEQYTSGYCETCYSTDYRAILKVGHHDLFNELCTHDGKYIILKIYY